jgi:PadR family transcriptional regulator PadR
MEDRRAQWMRGVLDLCVLAALSDGERYGYDLVRFLEHSGIGRVKGGTLYPLLARLEAAELVTGEWRPGRQGQGRRYYALTDQGRRRLEEQASAWEEFAARTTEVLDKGRGKQYEH